MTRASGRSAFSRCAATYSSIARDQPFPVRGRQPVLRHRRQQRGRLEPDAAHRIVEQAARELPALLDRQKAERAQRPQPDQRVGVGEAALRRADRLAARISGEHPRARSRARSPARRRRRELQQQRPGLRRARPGPRQMPRSRSESPCAPARASARSRPPPRPHPCRRGSRCSCWRRRSARTDPAAGCGSHDRGAGRPPCRSAPACGRPGSPPPASPPHGGDARPRRISPASWHW